ncbi:YqeB family protein [Bacillus mycoides]
MSDKYTSLNFSKTDKIILWIGFPLSGLIFGWFLPSIAKWGSSLPWLPYQGPLKLIASYSGAWVGFVTMILGLITGIILILLSYHESLETSVYDEKVVLKLRDEKIILKRQDISLVFMDNKQLVLLGDDDKELFRCKQELNKSRVSTAFKKHNYVWSDTDPFKQDFKIWVEDSHDLSPAANALLKARKIAIEKRNDEEAFLLIQELWKLRVSVKVNNKKQYYR